MAKMKSIGNVNGWRKAAMAKYVAQYTWRN